MPKKTIIICDDNRVLIDIFKFVFRKDNINVLTLLDGRELSALAKQQSPALIILDVMMPGKDGLSALRDLSSDPATAAIPVVMVSSVVSQDTVNQAKKLGAKEFIEKPFNAARLRELVSRYLAQGGKAKE